MITTLSTDDILLRVQDDSYQRINAETSLSTVGLVFERKATTEQEILRQLNVRRGKNGKIGACILVAMPVLTPETDGNGRTRVVQTFTVLENPTLNRSAQGSMLAAELIAMRLYGLFAGIAMTQAQVMSPLEPSTIVPDNSWKGMVAYEVRLQTFVRLIRARRVGNVMIDYTEPGALPVQLTITCATADAQIYYTTNGTYPSSANAAATLYTAPFTVTTPCRVRAAAEKTGLQQGNVAEEIFGSNVEFTEEFSTEFS